MRQIVDTNHRGFWEEVVGLIICEKVHMFSVPWGNSLLAIGGENIPACGHLIL